MISCIRRAFARKPHIQIVSHAMAPWLRIIGPNGEILASSETYADLSNARRAAKHWHDLTGWEVRDA